MSDTPPLKEQTAWPIHFYDMGRAQDNGTIFFNPAILRMVGQEWLLARRQRVSKIGPIGFNDLMVFRLDPESHQPVVGMHLDIPRTYQDEQFEDPRVFQTSGGNLWVSACNFQITRHGTMTHTHQVLACCGPDWGIQGRIDPIYEHNGGSVAMNDGHEKNWVWFEHDMLLHLVYLTDPHVVVAFGPDGAVLEEFRTTAITQWKHGTPRGGSAPVRVKNEFWSFFHSHTLRENGLRQYHMGAYSFEAKPPFAITRMTHVPLLSGTDREPLSPNAKSWVVFPCGAYLLDGTWTVSLGVNDNRCASIRIPHSQLCMIARPVSEPSNAKVPATLRADKTPVPV